MALVSIQATADVLENGDVWVAMFGWVDGAWNYFNGTEYVVITDSVPQFATISSSTAQSWTLPETNISSGVFIFGIGGLPPIFSGGVPTEPANPAGLTTIYDVVEFSYNPNDTPSNVSINTTAIDQFGLPIQIQITPAASGLPNGAGVWLDRTDVLNGYPTYVGPTSPFLQCAQDLFGNTITERLLSPDFAIQGNCVQAVQAGNLPNVVGSLAAGTYYYAVTALSTAANPIESYAQFNTATYTVTTIGESVNVSWANPQPWGPSPGAGLIGSYNVYRGTASGSSVTWVLLANVPADQYALGDSGQTPVNAAASPPTNPLNTFFDSVITTFFETYQSSQITLTSTYGDAAGDNLEYTFTGEGATVGCNPVLQFTVSSVFDLTLGTPASKPPVPVGTLFNIYNPFWSTNCWNAELPAPPTWASNTDVPPSVMVFGAFGVFADSSDQPVPVPEADTATFQALLGNLENQIVSAITRGIANSSMNPQNWGNNTSPIVTGAVPAGLPSGQTKSYLEAGEPCYYVVTAVNANGETICSLEFNATPSASEPCVEITWLPMSLDQATSFNVYRGTESQAENVYVSVENNANSSVTSYVDYGECGTPQNPPAYYPTGGTWPAYNAYLHQPSISINGAAYTFPFDDNNSQATLLSSDDPTAISISIGPWTSAG